MFQNMWEHLIFVPRRGTLLPVLQRKYNASEKIILLSVVWNLLSWKCMLQWICVFVMRFLLWSKVTLCFIFAWFESHPLICKKEAGPICHSRPVAFAIAGGFWEMRGIAHLVSIPCAHFSSSLPRPHVSCGQVWEEAWIYYPALGVTLPSC